MGPLTTPSTTRASSYSVAGAGSRHMLSGNSMGGSQPGSAHRIVSQSANPRVVQSGSYHTSSQSTRLASAGSHASAYQGGSRPGSASFAPTRGYHGGRSSDDHVAQMLS